MQYLNRAESCLQFYVFFSVLFFLVSNHLHDFVMFTVTEIISESMSLNEIIPSSISGAFFHVTFELYSVYLILSPLCTNPNRCLNTGKRQVRHARYSVLTLHNVIVLLPVSRLTWRHRRIPADRSIPCHETQLQSSVGIRRSWRRCKS